LYASFKSGTTIDSYKLALLGLYYVNRQDNLKSNEVF